MENKSATQTFATYLAKQYIVKKGFRPGTVPEANALMSAADVVLTLSDGMRFEIVCIVDREKNAGRRFAIARDALEEIGRSCLKYAGKMGRTQLPVTLHVVEVGALDAADRARLKAYKRKGFFSKAVLVGWAVDPAAGTVWTNAPFNGRMIGRGFIERLLREPRESDADMRSAPALPERARFPLLTCALLAVLAAVFAAEIEYGIEPWTGLLKPGVRTLVAFGGLYPELVLKSGEWWRLLTAAFLHADPLHLLLNGIALYMAGYVLETLVGRAWFLALFVIGALGGSLLSLAINPATMVSVGASGAIMGLLAAATVCSFRFREGPERMQIQMGLLQVLIPSLIPLAVTRTGGQIDFAAHIGGAATGVVAGVIMLKTWGETNVRPRLAGLAAAVCVAGAAAIGLAVGPLREHYGSLTLETLLIPNEQLPKSEADVRSRSADLVARYPRDPRAHFMRASVLLQDRNPAAAEQALRTGLKEEQILKTKLNPDFEARMRATLALVLLERGQAVEAKAVAQPACGAGGAMRERLAALQLCP
jgi:rhomboid protease GluP